MSIIFQTIIKMIKKPRVSVLICGHKIDEYIGPALASVEEQTGIDFEVVFVANGPERHAVSEYVRNNWKSPKPIKIISTEIPQLAFSLNLGLSYCNYDYVIRMDTDDVCLPGRFVKLYSFIVENDLDIAGSDVYLINNLGSVIGKRTYPRSKNISRRIWFSNPICHPSVIFKKESVIKIQSYNSGLASEDYDLWFRGLRHGLRFDNCPDYLLSYRIHIDSTQNNMLAYVEVISLSVREFLLTPSFKGGLGVVWSCFKFLMKILAHVFKR